MKYLLTQEELDALVPKADLEESAKAIELMWDIMGKQGMLDCVGSDGLRHGTYCDECPLSGLSKDHDLYKSYWLACTKPHGYSK